MSKIYNLSNDYGYRFADVNSDLSEKYTGKFNQFITPVINNIDDLAFSTWKYRYYIGAKYILAITGLVNSFRYAQRNNLGMVLPYLAYYSLLNAGRVLLCVNPKNCWKNSGLIKSSHNKIINLVCDEISLFNKEEGEKIKESFINYKDFREIFSYNFAFGGFNTISSELVFTEKSLISNVSYILEFAQFQSYLFSKKYQETHPNFHQILEEPFQNADIYEINGSTVIDTEDAFRIAKLFRKKSSLYPLSYSFSDGMLEDYFAGIGKVGQLNKYHYDPDQELNIVFDIEF